MHEREASHTFSGVCAQLAQHMNAHACSRRGIDAQIKSSSARLNGFAALDRSNSIIVTPVSTSTAERTLANTLLAVSLIADAQLHLAAEVIVSSCATLPHLALTPAIAAV